MTSADIDAVLHYLQRIVPRGQSEEIELSQLLHKLKLEKKKKKGASNERSS